MIKEAIIKIVNKEDLSYEAARETMLEIMRGETSATQNAAFLAGGLSPDDVEDAIRLTQPYAVDGIVLPDVPYEEREEFAEVFDRYGIDLISMIAPTSEDRIAMISKEAKGFLYMVSSLGVTGTRSEITTDIGAMTALVKKNSKVPCAVGFGISTPEQARKMAELSDGAIVGSAIIKLIAKHGTNAAGPVRDYVKEMADAVHAV